jgi:long-chain acyl-CoA synthetase
MSIDDGSHGRRLGFWWIAEDEPDRPALVVPDGEPTTFGELLASANRAAHGLRAAGLRPGDAIAVVLPNVAEYFVLQLAAMQSGLYFTPLNYHLTAGEIAYIVRDSEARVLVAHERFAETALAAALEAKLPAKACFSVGTIQGFRPLAELTEGQPDTPPAERRCGQVMAYTSGTTGRPKGVRRPLPDRDPSENAAQGAVFARAFQLVPFDGVHLVVGPLYHAGPSAFSWGSLHVGHLQVLTDRFDPEKTLRLIERYLVTNTHLVSTMFHRLLALPDVVRNKYDVSSLRMVVHSAAPTPVELKRRMMKWWGPVLWETYGGTEGAATIAKPHRWLERPGTAGRCVRGVTISILDEAGRPCSPGTPGTVYIETSGPRFEYWKDPELTKKAYRGRAFTLGDIGYVDDDGYLFLTGRRSEVIISGGVNIYPAEAESVLLSHPAVADVAVIGTPDDEWGEQVKAVVQLRSGHAPSPQLAAELIEHCRARIAHYKCPRSVDFRPKLPREENGKLYRRRIRREYWQQTGRSI